MSENHHKSFALKKRPLQNETKQSPEIIDLTWSDSDEPSKKRQKSIPPNNYVDLTGSQPSLRTDIKSPSQDKDAGKFDYRGVLITSSHSNIKRQKVLPEERQKIKQAFNTQSREPLRFSTNAASVASANALTHPTRNGVLPQTSGNNSQTSSSIQKSRTAGTLTNDEKMGMPQSRGKETNVPFRPSPSRPLPATSSNMGVKLSGTPAYMPKVVIEIPKPVWKNKVAVEPPTQGFKDKELDQDIYPHIRPVKLREIDRKQIDLGLGNPRNRKTKKAEFFKDVIHPRDQVKAIFADRFLEPSSTSLTVSTGTGNRMMDGKFQFISEYIFRKGIKKKDKSPANQLGCFCLDTNCNVDCACVPKEFQSHIESGGKQLHPYHRRSDGLLVLSDDYINEEMARMEILECNKSCSCSIDCDNRLVQQSRTLPLEIFETERCGWGVRALRDIVRGQFIDLYLGEIITEAELQRREDATEEGTPSYIMSLDWFAGPNSSIYHIDATNFGSIMRFVNHSCQPNAKTFTIMNPERGKHLHLVGFFAIADIPAGQEIRIDYDPNAERVDDQSMDEEDIVRCMCKEPNCRKRLWKKAKTRRPRKRLPGRGVDD